VCRGLSAVEWPYIVSAFHPLKNFQRVARGPRRRESLVVSAALERVCRAEPLSLTSTRPLEVWPRGETLGHRLIAGRPVILALGRF